MANESVEFVCEVVLWYDKQAGNTYHSVKITRCADKKQLFSEMTYGYGEAFKQSALAKMLENKWLPPKYTKESVYLFERENGYPILWSVRYGLKGECIANGVDI
jgi:hypothetical protein